MTTGIKVHVALSQAALENNESFMAQCQDDNGYPPYNEEEDESSTMAMNESMDTYATKSPDRRSAAANSPVVTKKGMSYSSLNAKVEATWNAIGSNQALQQKLYAAIDVVHTEALSMNQPNNENVAIGIQSFPPMDKAKTSKRLEAFPSGKHAAEKAKSKGKKRAAKKTPK